MRPRLSPRGVFYGWWMVAAGMVIHMLVSGLMFQAYGAYVVVLRNEFGWSTTVFSLGFAMTRVESGVLGPLQGWLIDRFGPRTITRIGLLVMAVGFVLFSRIESQAMFFLAYFVIAVGGGVGGFMTAAVAIVNWFDRRRATALSLMGVGGAVGGLMVPVVVLSLEEFGWRTTALASGVIIAVVGTGLAGLLRHRPEPYGLTIDGVPDETRSARSAIAARRDFTAREALRTSQFWLLSLGHASALLVVSALMVHLVLHLTEGLGYSLGRAALVVALMTGCQLAGQIGGGVIGDRFSKRAIVVVCMLGHTVALLILANASAFWMVALFAVVQGVVWGGRGPLMGAIRADYFGRAAFGTIMGFSSLIVMLGMILGPLIAGALADATGGYETGFTLLGILAGVGSLFFVLAPPPAPPAAAETPEQLARRLAPRPGPSQAAPPGG